MMPRRASARTWACRCGSAWGWGYIPAGLVDQVLTETGRVQQRVRRLPARAMVWFILALTLFHGQGYRSVWRELAHDGDDAPTPSASGLSQARRRLGVAPLAALFARLRGTQALPGAPGAFLAGLRLVSWDATMLDVPDSPANAAAFIRSRNRKGSGAFPKVRLMTLIEVGTHAVIDAVFGATSEQVLARRVLGSLGEGMLLLGDRNFPSYRLWRETAGTGAHLLWRVKASMLLPRVGTFSDGSWLAVLPRPGTGRGVGIWVRVVEYRVTVTTTDPRGVTMTRTELFRLVTTITDPDLADAVELADCYRQRWESETGYKSLKTHQRGPRQVLRSQDPEGMNQELYAYLITYQALSVPVSPCAGSCTRPPSPRTSTPTGCRSPPRCAPYAVSSPPPLASSTTPSTARSPRSSKTSTNAATESAHAPSNDRRVPIHPRNTPPSRHPRPSTTQSESSTRNSHDLRQRLSSRHCP